MPQVSRLPRMARSSWMRRNQNCRQPRKHWIRRRERRQQPACSWMSRRRPWKDRNPPLCSSSQNCRARKKKLELPWKILRNSSRRPLQVLLPLKKPKLLLKPNWKTRKHFLKKCAQSLKHSWPASQHSLRKAKLVWPSWKKV